MTMKNKQLQWMQSGEISTALLKLGLPTMVGMLVSAFYNIVDAFFVSRLGSSQMAAVTVAFPIILVLVGLGMIFGTGAASYVSRLLGEHDLVGASGVAATALYSGLMAGVVFMAVVLLLLEPLLECLGATPTMLPYAKEFTMIYLLGSVLTVFGMVMDQLATAEGLTRIPMIAMIFGSVLNMILNPLLIYTAGLGIGGSAWASVISMAATSLVFLWFMLSHKGVLRYSPAYFTFDLRVFTEIFKIGVPAFIFQFLQSVAMGLTNTAAGVYGDSVVAAYGVLWRVFPFGYFVVFGFLKGYQPFAGYNYGAKQYDRLRKATKIALRWSTEFCMLFAILFIVFPDMIMAQFGVGDAVFMEIGRQAFQANGIGFLACGFGMVYMTLFLAIGNSKAGGLLSISRQGLFYIPIILVFPHVFGINGIIWAQLCADVLNTILTWVLRCKLLGNLRPEPKT